MSHLSDLGFSKVCFNSSCLCPSLFFVCVCSAKHVTGVWQANTNGTRYLPSELDHVKHTALTHSHSLFVLEPWQPLPLVTITEEHEDALNKSLFKRMLRHVGLVPPANEQVSRVTSADHHNLLSFISRVCHFGCIVKFACITDFHKLFLVMGFISLVYDIF